MHIVAHSKTSVLLTKSAALPACFDLQGMRALHEAASCGKQEVVAALIQHGEDPNVLGHKVLSCQ